MACGAEGGDPHIDNGLFSGKLGEGMGGVLGGGDSECPHTNPCYSQISIHSQEKSDQVTYSRSAKIELSYLSDYASLLPGLLFFLSSHKQGEIDSWNGKTHGVVSQI